MAAGNYLLPFSISFIDCRKKHSNPIFALKTPREVNCHRRRVDLTKSKNPLRTLPVTSQRILLSADTGQRFPAVLCNGRRAFRKPTFIRLGLYYWGLRAHCLCPSAWPACPEARAHLHSTSCRTGCGGPHHPGTLFLEKTAITLSFDRRPEFSGTGFGYS